MNEVLFFPHCSSMTLKSPDSPLPSSLPPVGNLVAEVAVDVGLVRAQIEALASLEACTWTRLHHACNRHVLKGNAWSRGGALLTLAKPILPPKKTISDYSVQCNVAWYLNRVCALDLVHRRSSHKLCTKQKVRQAKGRGRRIFVRACAGISMHV